jgi:Zn finger protein HypA/HybF involved in hydrogenase expression
VTWWCHKCDRELPGYYVKCPRCGTSRKESH